MKISIVTISYNQAKFLERTLRSVIDQDYQNIEYIVVDPGSSDGSRSIINAYKEHISKIIFEPDSGPSDGLNKGFSYASGDVYGFINSDDILLPGALQKVADFFEKNPKKDLVSGHTVIIDENDQKVRNSYSDKFTLKGYAYGANVLMQPSTFFKASAYNKTSGFNVRNRSNWDGELFLDLYLSGSSLSILNEFLSCYRLQRDSITSTKKLDSLISDYYEGIFKKIMCREKKPIDRVLSVYYRFIKHVSNPRAFCERVFKGPVYGRGN